MELLTDPQQLEDPERVMRLMNHLIGEINRLQSIEALPPILIRQGPEGISLELENSDGSRSSTSDDPAIPPDYPTEIPVLLTSGPPTYEPDAGEYPTIIAAGGVPYWWNGTAWVILNTSGSGGGGSLQITEIDFSPAGFPITLAFDQNDGFGVEYPTSTLCYVHMHDADTTHVGVVNTTTQTFAGAKTFQDVVTVAGLSIDPTYAFTAPGGQNAYLKFNPNFSPGYPMMEMFCQDGSGTFGLARLTTYPLGPPKFVLDWDSRGLININNLDGQNSDGTFTGGLVFEGGVWVGGFLSSTGMTVAWADITGTPTTLAGYGITDATENAQDATAAMIAAGSHSGISFSYSDVSNALSATIIYLTQMSLTSDGAGLKLVNDTGVPGNSKYYGTDSGGTRGWQSFPTTSAQLATIITDETGSGALVFAGSPALTGTPTAPTATAGTNTTQLATTAFVAAAVSGMGTGTVTNIATGSGLTGGPITTTGTISVATSGITTTLIADANVTLAKIANAAANSKLLGSGASGLGAPYSEITVGTGLTMTGTTLSASGGSGTVTSVSASGNQGITVSGSPITTSGSLNLGLGNITPTSIDCTGIASFTVTNATTSNTSYVLNISHNSSGTPVAGFGSVTGWYLKSDTVTFREASEAIVTWVTATDASRKARWVLNVYDTFTRECIRMEASGTAPMIGFLGANASPRLVSPDIGTALNTFGLTSGTPTFAAASLSGSITTANGGTGVNSSAWAQGDLVYISATGTWNHLTKDTNATRYLSNTGTTNNPAWAQVDLTTGITGVLPAANGGPITGEIRMWSTASAPTGWLLCDGSSQLRAGALAALFAVIGTTYGSVDGTHFTLPDMRGRVVLGVGTGTYAGATARSLAATGGLETHQLSTAEMPAHTHTYQDSYFAGAGSAVGASAAVGSVRDTSSTGGGGSHNNMQPWIALNFIIKT